MKIDLAEVRRIAKLSCLEFEDDEFHLLAEQLSAILTYMQTLARVDTEAVDPTFHSLAHEAPLREDASRPGLSAEEATRGAPSAAPGTGGGQFLVPRVIG